MDRVEPRLHEGLARLLGEPGRLVHLERVGRDLLLGERPDRLTQRVALLAEAVQVEIGVHGDPPYTAAFRHTILGRPTIVGARDLEGMWSRLRSARPRPDAADATGIGARRAKSGARSGRSPTPMR